MREKIFKQITSMIVAVVMVLGLIAPSGVAVAAEPKFPFGTKGTMISAGTYDLPISMKNADKPQNPSMAADCVKGGSLEVMKDGSAFVNVKLGVKKMGVVEGWSSNWEIYKGYDRTSETFATDVVTKDEAGHETEIRFKLPYTDKDGVYCKMCVKVVNMNPDAYLEFDFESVGNAKPDKPEPKPEVKKGTAEVGFGGKKAYDVTAEVSVLGNKISNVVLGHNAKEAGHEGSVQYAENAKAMADKFIGIGSDNKAAIETLDAVAGATITSDAYKTAVLKALDLYVAPEPEKPADFTFGSANTELKSGTYMVPVDLRNAGKHSKPSNAAAAFPAVATLTIDEKGTATITSDIHPVTVGPITDMSYDIKYYVEDNYESETKNVEILETIKKPESMPSPGKEVPAKIKFTIPNNDWDGVYMNFTVDAMGPGYPDAWLEIDYANAKVPGKVEHFNGAAKVNQFGKYTIHTDVTVQDGVISNVDVTADSFISETHKPTNLAKTAQVAKALKNNWNGMAPTQENAEKIFKKIMKETDPDEVIDTVSGATYSAKAVRDAVMDAFGLEYQDEVINVPKSVEPGVYEVEIGYYSDVVWHSLVENVKTKAILTVNADKTMNLEFDTKSGTEKEPLYILGFNGVYPDNDRNQKLTLDGCTYEMGLSSNDYEDEFFAKGTEVVNHVKFPLLGGVNKVYTTNAYLYVPAMKRLNGELSGVYFEDGHFNVDIFAKVYWDGMKKIDDVPTGTTGKVGTVNVTMMQESGKAPSMCDPLFAERADVSVIGDKAYLKLYVAYPIPGFPDLGTDGSVKNVKIYYNGKEYTATSDITSKPMMTAKADNPLFGLEKGKQYTAQVLTFALPKEAIEEENLAVSAYVNVVMNSEVDFKMKLTGLVLEEGTPEEPEVKPEEKPEEKPEVPETKPETEPETKPDETLDRYHLKDGVYMVTGKMLKTDKAAASMADNAINHNIKLTVKNGKYYISLDFQGMKIGSKLGYLGKLQYFLSGYRTDANGKPVGRLGNVTVNSYQLDKNGERVKDQYGTDYPNVVTFELIPEALKNGYVPLQVFVPVMDAIAAGSGNQQVYLKLNWNTLKATTNNNPAFNSNSSVVPGVKTSDVVQNNTIWAAVLLLGCVIAFAGYTENKKHSIK